MRRFQVNQAERRDRALHWINPTKEQAVSTQIRVDRVNQPCAPCGMNSILYLGGDFRAAKREYDRAEGGVDTWGQPNASYGGRAVGVGRHQARLRHQVSERSVAMPEIQVPFPDSYESILSGAIDRAEE